MRQSDPSTRLSGLLLTQLGTPGQFLLWALRQRLRDGVPGGNLLVRGFLSTFGIARLESALAEFEALFAVLARRHAVDLCPLACAFVSWDEAAVVDFVVGAVPGHHRLRMFDRPFATDLEVAAAGVRRHLDEALACPRPLVSPVCTRPVLH